MTLTTSTVNGRSVALPAAAKTVLDACRAAGAEVPTLCHDDASPRAGTVALAWSRSTDASSPRARRRSAPARRSSPTARRCATTARTCSSSWRPSRASRGAPPSTPRRSKLKGDRYGARATRRRPRRPRRPRHVSHPYLRLDLDACILCRLCVRACDEIQGQFVYAVEGRGATPAHLRTWGPAPFRRQPVRVLRRLRERVPDRRHQRSRPRSGAHDPGRPHGADDLRLLRRRVPARGARRRTSGCCASTGAKSPANHEHLCVKGRYAHALLAPPGAAHAAAREERWRARAGVLGGGSRPRGVWIRADPRGRRTDRGAVVRARCTNEENYLLQKWLRGAFGTHNVDCCARVCHAPSAAGMRQSLGTGAATNSARRHRARRPPAGRGQQHHRGPPGHRRAHQPARALGGRRS